MLNAATCDDAVGLTTENASSSERYGFHMEDCDRPTFLEDDRPESPIDIETVSGDIPVAAMMYQLTDKSNEGANESDIMTPNTRSNEHSAENNAQQHCNM